MFPQTLSDRVFALFWRYPTPLLSLSLAAVACSASLPTPAVPTVVVTNAAQLEQALATAKPGNIIELQDGTYTGPFTIPAGVSGTATAPIVLVGSKQALFQTGDLRNGKPALYLAGNAYWELRGFAVRNSKKGIVVDSSHHNVFDQLTIYSIGEEGLHLRRGSSYNVLRNSSIRDTGLSDPGYGEGCYIGSAASNWTTYSNGQPDACNFNEVRDNVFGPDVRAEHIDVKEGTEGGRISGNTFNGAGMSGQNYADSWLDVKGNGYVVEHNTGTAALQDGYQTHVVVPGWGRNNVFVRNRCDVQAPGYGFNIQLVNGGPAGNVVYASNTVLNAGRGPANVPITP